MANRLVNFVLLLMLSTITAVPAFADDYAFGNTSGAPLATLTVTTTTGTTVLTAASQGWTDFSDGIYVEAPTSTNYVVGNIDGSSFSDFFTFDVSSVTGTVTGATLNLTVGDVLANTSQDTLFASLDFGTSSNAATYGNFAIPTTALAAFGLTGTSAGDLSEAISSGQSFTVDGSLLLSALPTPTPCTLPPKECPVIIHQGSGNGMVGHAEVEIGPSSMQVPEPGTNLLLVVGVAILTLLRRRLPRRLEAHKS